MSKVKLLKASDTINFWKKDDIMDLDTRIPFIAKSGVDQRGRWPGNPPDWREIERELAASRSAYIEVTRNKDRDGIYFKLLTGRFVLSGSIWHNDSGYPRLSLNKKGGISFANNKLRSNMAVRASHFQHDGICLVTPNDYRLTFEQKNTHYRTGSYLEKIMQHCRSTSDDSDADTMSLDDFAGTLSENEEHLLKTLETFIDGEYELEQQTARSEPGFAFLKVAPEPRKSSVRKFYRMTILESDYRRLCDGKYSMISVESSDGQDILLQIESLDANALKCEIIVSTVQQIAAGQFPENGLLKLVALDTLLKVRKGVVEELRNGTSCNSWLTKLASGVHHHETVKPVKVQLPPSEFPPNPSQVKAINLGAGTPDYTLVLGPPGTGKTTVIYNWVEHFVAQGKRILISSQNNKAVDNVLERVAKNDNLTCVRIGNESKVSSGIHHLLIDNCATDLQKRLMSTLDERMEAVTYSHKLIHELITCLSGNSTIEDVLTTAKKTQQYVQENMSLLESFVIGNESEGILASIDKLQTESNNYHATMARHQDLSERTGWLTPFYRIGALWQKFQSKRIMGKAQADKKRLLPVIEAKSIQLDELFKEIGVWHTTISNVRQESLYPILIKLVDVVGATCIGINTSNFFKDTEFDVVIIDESGQIQLHNLIVPLSRADHVILVGDHKQLPPVVSEELKIEVKSRAEVESFDISTELIDKSWFEVLWDRAPEDRRVMLDTQFRCPSLISDFISDAFYDNQYFAGESMKKKQPIFSFFNSTMVFMDTSKKPVAERSEQSRKIGKRTEVLGNRCETKLVIQLLLQVLDEKPELGQNGEIGVIVPYANHVQEIQRAIIAEQKQGRLTELATPVLELVASVDSYQGQERDLIIFMFTRSNKDSSIGFLADWRRLNVAMTRAKKQLVMIGDLSTLAAKPRQGAVDFEFKVAMQKLQTFLKSKCQLIYLSNANQEENTQDVVELSEIIEEQVSVFE